jgi:predicted choloylglycine hydrolase
VFKPRPPHGPGKEKERSFYEQGANEMNESNLKGTYYQMGLEQGRILRSVGFVPPPISQAKREFAKACESAVQQYIPELLEELQGIADGGGFEADLVNGLVLTLDAKPACSVLAVSGRHTADGKTLFGRNYDFYTSFRDFSALYRTYPDRALASLGCSDIFVGREDGVNEAGLTIAMTFVGYESDQPGVMFHLAVRAVLDRCHSVQEAVALLESVPHMRNNNYLVAGVDGQIAIVEAGPENVTTIYPAEGFAAITNHFQFSPYEQIRRRPTNSEPHLRNLKEWFNKREGNISRDNVKEVLSDPEKGVFCTHYQEKKGSEPIVTLWSWTATLGERNMYLAEGKPDKGAYRTYEF